MKANTIVTGSLCKRFPLVLLLIIVSLAGTTIQANEKSTMHFTTLDQYGFLHPKTYTYDSSDKFVFTRFFVGDLNYTLGNWEDEINMALLPKMEMVPKSGSQQTKSQTNAEYERAQEHVSKGVIENINYQDKFENFYRTNIFGYDVPNFFSPDLEGYMHVMQQLSGMYTLIGKIYLYIMFVIGAFILKAGKYFDHVELDAIPRSLNNRIKDKFFKISKKRAVRDRRNNLCGTCFGLILVIGFGLLYVQICFDNTKQIRTSGTTLYSQIRHLTKTLRDTSAGIGAVNVPGQKVPQSASGGDELVVSDVINDSKIHEIAFQKKAHALYNDIMESTNMSKPSLMYMILFILGVMFGFYYYQGYNKHAKYISLFGFIITIFCGTFLLFLLGGLVDDLYIFKEICNVIVTKDTKLQSQEIIDIRASMSNIAEYHLEKYLHCYNFDFNEMVRTQILNMDVAQLALFKASKIVLGDLSDTLASNSKINKVPLGVPELIANKGNYMKLPDEQHFVIKYIQKIEAINALKKKLVLLPNCIELTPWFDTFMQNVCLDSIDYGINLYWLVIAIFAGTVLLAWGFLKTEILNKQIRDAIAYQPSHLFMRYANDVSKNVDEYGGENE